MIDHLIVWQCDTIYTIISDSSHIIVQIFPPSTVVSVLRPGERARGQASAIISDELLQNQLCIALFLFQW